MTVNFYSGNYTYRAAGYQQKFVRYDNGTQREYLTTSGQGMMGASFRNLRLYSDSACRTQISGSTASILHWTYGYVTGTPNTKASFSPVIKRLVITNPTLTTYYVKVNVYGRTYLADIDINAGYGVLRVTVPTGVSPTYVGTEATSLSWVTPAQITLPSYRVHWCTENGSKYYSWENTTSIYSYNTTLDVTSKDFSPSRDASTSSRKAVYEDVYVSASASVSCTGLAMSGTTALINNSYSGRVLVSTDNINFTYLSSTSLNGLLNTSSTPVYTAILSDSGSILGLTNGTSYTKTDIESKVADYNTSQSISVERIELEKVASYLNNIRDGSINEINRKYNEFYNTGTRYYQDVRTIILQAY